MKLFYLVAALSAVPMWAGVRIKVETVDLKTNESTQQEILLDAERLRVNMSGKSAMSVLFLTDNGRNRMVILDPARNEYRDLDEQTMKQLSQQMQGAMAQMQAQLQNLPPEQRARVEQMMRGRGMPQLGQAAPEVRTTYTSDGSGSVNGFSCTKYEGKRGTEKVAEVCAAKPADLHFNPADFQVFEKMREFASTLTSGLANSPFANIGRITSVADQGFEGFPVQRMGFSGGQATDKTELKSIERTNFSDPDFSLGNAKKVDLMPGRR
jgi:hypothetical protein